MMSVLEQSSVPKEAVIFSCAMSLSPKGEKQSVSRQASHNQLFPFLNPAGAFRGFVVVAVWFLARGYFLQALSLSNAITGNIKTALHMATKRHV